MEQPREEADANRFGWLIVRILPMRHKPIFKSYRGVR